MVLGDGVSSELSQHINITSEWGYVEVDTTEVGPQLTHLSLIDALFKANYNTLNDWYEKDPKLRAMASSIGIEWPQYEQDLASFLEDDLTLPQAKKLIEGF